MTMQVNSSSATDNIYGGCSDKTAADGNRQEPVSIFSDKNNNGIVDKKDFDDEATAQLAFEKGLLGRSWDAVKDFIDKLLTTDATENLTKETRYNETTNENYQADIDSSGKEVRRTYYKEDGTVDEIVNLEYDEDENLTNKIYIDAEGNVRQKQVFRSDGTRIKTTQYAESYNIEELYDENGKVISRTITYTGEIPPAYDGTNGSKFAKSMYDIYHKLPVTSERTSAFESVLEDIFGDKLDHIYSARSGSTTIYLKDGTTLYINTAWDGDGSLTITHPDRTVEKYSPEGELLE